jgi:hypothetical protein
METNKENNDSNTKSSTAMAGMPDWVMHLLTGLGAMGADFLLFIKPLQDKFEAQSKQIKEQETRISELEDKVESLIKKPEKKEHTRETVREPVDELFNVRKRTSSGARFQKPNYVKL